MLDADLCLVRADNAKTEKISGKKRQHTDEMEEVDELESGREVNASMSTEHPHSWRLASCLGRCCLLSFSYNVGTLTTGPLQCNRHQSQMSW
jgi:hypothetical protein